MNTSVKSPGDNLSARAAQRTGLLRHIQQLNHWNPDHFRPFTIAGRRVGYIRHSVCGVLAQWPRYFQVSSQAVALMAGDNFDARSQVLDEVVQELVAQGLIAHYLNEPYPVCAGLGREHQYAQVDRGAVACFGIRAFGQHLNGYLHNTNGLSIWVARRAPDRLHFPDKLDNLVAGGLPQNLDLRSNLLKECKEEADLPPELAANAHSTGAISYCCETGAGLKPDTLYCYDLELPPSFIPRNSDGEVADFQLMPAEDVLRLVEQSDEFKANCNLVFIDFLIRHGVIPPEHPDYLELIQGLHV